MSKRAWHEVTFRLEVDLDDDARPEDQEAIVEEAVTALVDEELASMGEDGTRCGLHFNDAVTFSAKVSP